MSPSDKPFHLWIATDDTRTVAAVAPLKVSRASIKREWGSITELRATPVQQKDPNIAGIIVLATLVLIGAFGLFLSGAPFLVIFFLAVLALGVGLARTLPKAPPGEVVAADLAKFPGLHHALDDDERVVFFDLLELAERAGRALPTVERVIDPVEGGQLLAQTLWEAADVLSRRRPLRPQVRRQELPALAAVPSSHAASMLAEQREKVRTLWEENEAELARIQVALELAAVAAENAAHDLDAQHAVREAYRELAGISGARS